MSKAHQGRPEKQRAFQNADEKGFSVIIGGYLLSQLLYALFNVFFGKNTFSISRCIRNLLKIISERWTCGYRKSTNILSDTADCQHALFVRYNGDEGTRAFRNFFFYKKSFQRLCAIAAKK